MLFICRGNDAIVSLLDISDKDIFLERVVRVDGLTRRKEPEARWALFSAMLERFSYCIEPDMEEPLELRILSLKEPFRVAEVEAGGELWLVERWLGVTSRLVVGTCAGSCSGTGADRGAGVESGTEPGPL